MSYIIPYEPYIPLLQSNNEDTIKNAFQKIFELLVVGNRLSRNNVVHFKNDISFHIKSHSTKIRKWAYHCACFYYNQDIHGLILEQLKFESSTENIIWALTALSIVYDSEEKLRKCAHNRHDEFMKTISKNYLKDALFLFGGVIDINPNTILTTNNSADLAALSKIYAYGNLVSNKYPNITEAVIQEMRQNSDPYVREYSYWALSLHGTKNDQFDLNDDKDDGVRKWQISLQIKSNNEDFIISTLKPLACCPYKISLNIKLGILIGLSDIKYNFNFVSYICSWFNYEEEEPVLFKLIDYILCNCFENKDDGTYFDIIKDSLNDKILCDYITKKIASNPAYHLVLSYNNDNPVINFKKLEGSNVQNFNISGSGNNVAVATDNSSATINQPPKNDDLLIKLIDEVRQQTNNDFSKEEKEKILEVLSFIESEMASKSPKKPIISALLDGLKAIKGTVQFSAALVNLINFFSKS